ncbi:MAG: DUF4358 domain-containing protein [Clostridia bacterium]|nr:DUF4358 domain-containing protein [Clostridia bacterium]
MKKIIALLLAVVLMGSFLACAAKDNNNDKTDKYKDLALNVTEFGTELVGKCSFENALEPTDNDADSINFALTELLQLDPALLNSTGGVPELYFASTSSSPERVLVIGAKDAETAKTLSDETMKAWLENYAKLCEGYWDQHIPKLNTAVNKAAGRYVFIIVSNDNTAAAAALDDMLKAAVK